MTASSVLDASRREAMASEVPAMLGAEGRDLWGRVWSPAVTSVTADRSDEVLRACVTADKLASARAIYRGTEQARDARKVALLQHTFMAALSDLGLTPTARRGGRVAAQPQARRYTPPTPGKVWSKTCTVCSSDYRTTGWNSRRCDECKAAGLTPKSLRTQACARCGSAFTPRRATTRYCSRSCAHPVTPSGRTGKNHYDRVTRYGGLYQRVDRVVVFERDGWLCGICQGPVDRAAAWPAPTSASLDHIVPLSRGGDHTYLNVQCAHLRCNVAKGDGSRRLR